MCLRFYLLQNVTHLPGSNPGGFVALDPRNFRNGAAQKTATARAMTLNVEDKMKPRLRHLGCRPHRFRGVTVNQVVSKRFVKKQQMRWTPRGVCTSFYRLAPKFLTEISRGHSAAGIQLSGAKLKCCPHDRLAPGNLRPQLTIEVARSTI
jgi:hypothetical protein